MGCRLLTDSDTQTEVQAMRRMAYSCLCAAVNDASAWQLGIILWSMMKLHGKAGFAAAYGLSSASVITNEQYLY